MGWRGVRRWWSSYEGPILLGLLLGSLVVGYWGYWLYFGEPSHAESFWDLVYADLQLLTFSTESSPVEGQEINGLLQVARFLAPLVAGYSAFRALAQLFRDRVDQVRARFRRGHTIVAGAGDTGLAFVRSLREEKQKVVVIDDDPTNANLAACRENGALVLTLDAGQPEGLEQAGIGRARRLIAVCGDDGRNAEIVLNAQALFRGTELECLAHVVDADVWQLLRANELRRPDGKVRFRFFNVYEHGARSLLDAHPAFDEDTTQPHVLAVGDGLLVERLALQLARRWDHGRGRDEPLVLHVLGPRATAMTETLLASNPELAGRVDLQAADAPLDAMAVDRVTDLAAVDIAYVCVDTDSDAVVMAQALRNRLATAPIVVCLRLSQGLVRVLSESHLLGPPGLRQIEPFALLDRTCHPDLLRSGVYETLARAIHRHYQASQEDPVPDWDDLSAELQASNRNQAEDIGAKLQAIACDLVPRQSWSTNAFTFTTYEVELLAEQEHERWRAERLAAGWRYGPERSHEARTNPLLVPWTQLDRADREANHELIRGIPDLVGHADLEVVRIPSALATEAWVEPVARAIHEAYLRRRAADGQAGSTVPWEQLPPLKRASNRAQAVDIPTKLRAIGCRQVPGAEATGFDGFTDTEVEDLARIEHDRWVNERTAMGERESPDLVGWDDLPEERRELDREAVRAIPEVLAAADLGISRS